MRKFFKFCLFTALAVSLMGIAALAEATNAETGIVNINSIDKGATLTKIDDSRVSLVYTDTGASTEADYFLMVIEGDAPLTTVTINDGNIKNVIYVNQTTSVNKVASFTTAEGENQNVIGSTKYTSGKTYTVFLSTNAQDGQLSGKGLVPVASYQYQSSGPNPPMGYVLGDVDGNPGIDTSDAQSILKHVVQLELLTGDNYTAADTNGDGNVDTTDAQNVLKFVVQLIQSFDEVKVN